MVRKLVAAGTTLTISDTAVAFQDLFLDDGSTIAFAAGLKACQITCVQLTLNGKSTIDLTPVTTPFSVSAKPPTPHQADFGQNATTGVTGGAGQDGLSGVDLKMSVQKLAAATGSLWIRSDGTPGGPGGAGGDGAKGYGPDTRGSHCKDSGRGGNGGTGGRGGAGGDTSFVTLTIGPNTITPSQAVGFAPSSRPAAADIAGTIVIAGAPGKGGAGGPAGNGGPGGEFRKCKFPRGNSKAGANGGAGASGSNGADGRFNDGNLKPRASS